MTLKSFLLILQRQFTQKWGRFLLASGGIMIGIWAITLTSSLSLGLSDTIIKAINSQPSAKEFLLSRTKSAQTSFFDISEAPTFKALSQKDFEQIKSKYPAIQEIVPNNILNIYYLGDSKSCVNQNNANAKILKELEESGIDISNLTPEQQSQADSLARAFTEKCPTFSVPSGVFQNFYENNRTKWLGETKKPGRGEIVACFKCGSIELNKKLGVSDPKDMIGKEIEVEFAQAPQSYNAGQEVNVLRAQRGNQDIDKSVINKLKIVAVIDDRSSSTLSNGGNTNFYMDYSYFLDAIKLQKPTANIENLGYLQASVVINSYTDLDTTIKKLQNDGYLPLSLTQALIASVQTSFVVLTGVLVAFGLIALIASVFGIVNVMTISVLERQKEIGILKSLGARDRDIFSIFLIESAMLGLIGWILGTLLSLAFGALISFIFKTVINGNSEWKANLETLNIDSFAPSFPWWLLLGTLGIAVLFTVLSGVFPAIKAAKQNPVEVLRSE